MELIAEKREKLGKSTKALKREGLIPAVIFGKGEKSVPITLPKTQVEKAYKAGGETTLIDIKLGSSLEKVLFKEIQEDPITGQIIHAGFYKPNLKEKTEAQVPVEIVGEENNEYVKAGEAIALILVNEITVEALPMDLPHAFTVDISNMQVGDVVTAGALDYDKSKVTLSDLEDTDMVIKLDKMEAPVEEEEEKPVSEEELLEKIEATAESKEDETEDKDEEEK